MLILIGSKKFQARLTDDNIPERVFCFGLFVVFLVPLVMKMYGLEHSTELEICSLAFCVYKQINGGDRKLGV